MSQARVNIPLRINSCPKCFKSPKLTTWRGGPGFDPDMRQYKCPRCGTSVYRVISGSRHANLEIMVNEPS